MPKASRDSVWTSAEPRDADEFMVHLHNRLPITLERDLEDDWLDTEITSTSDILGILE
jgi:putative SOS response-associated peptidase YedK